MNGTPAVVQRLLELPITGAVSRYAARRHRALDAIERAARTGERVSGA